MYQNFGEYDKLHMNADLLNKKSYINYELDHALYSHLRKINLDMSYFVPYYSDSG